MRLRNVKGSRETIAANPLVIRDITEKKGQWHEVFGNLKSLYIEIGMGKGQFILEMARRNPDKNFIGIEKYSSVLVRGLEKLEEEGIPMASAEVTMIPQNWVELEDEEAVKNLQRTLDMLDEDDDVQAVYHNWDE